EWDNCGGAAKTPVTITVGSGSGSGGSTFANLHSKNGWTGYALEPPSYNICGSCKPGGPQTTWSLTQGVSSPSLSGNSTKTTSGGQDRKSTRLNSSHQIISYAVFCLQKKKHL